MINFNVKLGEINILDFMIVQAFFNAVFVVVGGLINLAMMNWL